MKRWLLNRYEAARSAGLPTPAASFPPLVQRYFSNLSGYEPAEFIRLLVGDVPRDVLVVGVGGGRDHYWLAAHGHRVTSIDLAFQPDIPLLVQGDMARLPLRRESFDCVVVADALEHTFEDREALLEFRRLLRAGGRLVLNVPFGDDAGEHHVRVYTEPTLRRLLESVGFRIERRVYRGLFPLLEQNVPGFQLLFHAINLMMYVLTGRTMYRAALRWLTMVDWRRGFRPGLRRLSRVHGGYIAAIPTTSARDFRQVNQAEYGNQGRRMAAAFLRRTGSES